MKEAGEEEKNLTIENGNVTEDGTPFITVIEDGGWPLLRSHGHCYRENYTKRLYALQKGSTTGTKKLSNEIIRRLKARGAIAHNAEEGDVNSLKEDLKNGTLHVFGIHTFCKPYFCTKIGESIDLPKEEKEICDKARFLLQPLVLKSHQLITNSTCNAAENYMSLVANFTGGKQINRGKRGSFTHRTKAASLDFQFKSYWH
ncbi:Uncharacterized protein GBIM_01954 [Gryllus bimaculatus]|nr:Uncharacterized protein GBIM_01954 [Gryllus bimaculatus]